MHNMVSSIRMCLQISLIVVWDQVLPCAAALITYRVRYTLFIYVRHVKLVLLFSSAASSTNDPFVHYLKGKVSNHTKICGLIKIKNI